MTFQLHLLPLRIVAIVAVVVVVTTSSSAHLTQNETPGGEQHPVSLSSHTERERVMANRQKNKELEMNRQMMSVLSVVSKKRNVNEFGFDGSNQRLVGDIGRYNFSAGEVRTTTTAKLEERRKHKEGFKIINVTGTKTKSDVIEFNLPDLSTLKKVTSVVLKVMVKSRKRLRKSVERVKVKVYAPDILQDEGPSTGSPLYFGTDRNQKRRSFFASSTTRRARQNPADARKRLKLISEIKIEPNKTKWAVIPISSWYVQEVLEHSVTRLKFVIRCDQCKGIRRENSNRRRNSSTKSSAPNINNNNNKDNDDNSTNVLLHHPPENSLNNNNNNNRTSRAHPNKSARRNVRHSNPKQQQQQQSRTHNYLPHILIYTRDV